MIHVQGDTRADRPAPTGASAAVTAGAYLTLFLLGGVEALIGTFHYSRGPGVVLAVCFALAIFATCILSAWGMQSAAGGVLPAVGWLVVALILGSSGAGGSVLIANTTSGKWFLFGGAICAGLGAIVAFAIWSVAGAGRAHGRPRGSARPR